MTSQFILKNQLGWKLAVVLLLVPVVSTGRAVALGQNSLSETFEVVSIRPADPNPAGGRGGGGRGDAGGGLLAPCSGAVQLSPGRINITNSTVFRVLTAAYGMNCRAALEVGLVSGLPDWASTARFDIQATTLNVGPYDVAPGALSVWPEIMQQLGLKLEPARGPLETLIIDRVEKPSSN